MMRLPKFVYHTPRTIAEAVKIVSDVGPEAQFVAGGTDLYPNMKRRQQMPKTVISVMRLPELNQVTGAGSQGTVIGASVTLTEICENEIIKRDYPVIASAARTISTPILRNMGTIGGNLLLDTRCNYYDQNYEWRKAINFCLKKDGDVCWVAPGSSKCWAVQSSDLVPVMVAIGAKFRFVSTAGERIVEARDFYKDDGIDYLNKRPDELLVDIHLPRTNGWRASYQKLRRRGAFDFPVLGVAAYVQFDDALPHGRATAPCGDVAIADARIVLGGIAPSPLQINEAAQQLIGHSLDDERIEAAAEAAYIKARPLDNTDFVYQWRKQMARQYTIRALRELM
ncbi:MAG TPA: FAD binding domain-containing protein [Pyrinomonadaceae bacterium]|jgi:4-hydroxybenzoyl-CoA reductase subunit beta|nr:FAD binding domain-containing protein [Pyrinomonadaceae bacterium]